MRTLIIISIVVFMAERIMWLFVLSKHDKGKHNGFRYGMYTLCWVIMWALSGTVVAVTRGYNYNEGQIDALKGVQTYEIQYVFPKGDSIPSDTLYVKLK